MKLSLKKEFRFAIGSPAIIWQICFFYIPIALLLLSSFIKSDYELSFTFSNFTPFISKAYLQIIFFTLLIATSTALFCALIAYPLAYFIAFKCRKFRFFFLFLLILPFWTNFLLHVYSWVFILEKHGFVNRALLWLGVINEPLALFNSLFSVILMLVYMYLPFMVLPIYSALERFNPLILEASQDLGATWRQTFSRILFPLTLPAIRTGFFLVLIPCFGEFIIPELMGGDRYFFVGNVITHLMLGDTTTHLGAAYTLICLFSLAFALILYNQFFQFISKRVDDRTGA